MSEWDKPSVDRAQTVMNIPFLQDTGERDLL